MNPYDVIWTLAQQSFGDVVVGTGSLTSLVNERNPSFQNTFKSALGDIMRYWNQRFSKIRSNLMLYGVSGNAVRGDVLQTAYQNKKPQFGKPFASQVVRQANGNTPSQMDFDPTDPSVTAFRTQFGQAGQVNFWQTEYQTKLEMANLCKEAIGFEFYMDTTGDIVFKPPFYNLDVLSNKPVSWIQNIDIISWDISDSEAEVVTQIQLQGNYAGNIDYGLSEEVTPYTSVTDYHLLMKYGWRSRTYNSEFLGNNQLMFYVGMDLLDRYNSKRSRATLTIPFRPELRLGFPIYLAPQDQIWYVQGISHNISFGGQATTTLTLTAKRSKFIAPKGIGTIQLTGYKGEKDSSARNLEDGEAVRLSARQMSQGGIFKADIGEAAQIPAVAPTTPGSDPYEPLILTHPKTNRRLGYPNVVMAYTRPFTPTPDELSDNMGQKKGTDPRVAQSKQKARDKAAQEQLQELNKTLTNTSGDDLRSRHLDNRYRYGISSAGVYTYLYDKTKVILEMLLLPAKNISFNTPDVSFSGNTGMIRPVSDERGFEVIGHHRYGRGVALRDGSLITDSPDQAQVGVQLAISGGLYESLQAQSHGLTTAQSGFANPADALARMVPEDLQTAGVINPETQKPEYVKQSPNFISSATLNSFEQSGSYTTPNVEASQLSRALTLAEMSVKMEVGVPNPSCDCILGRADLAFINVGYQVRFLRNSSSSEDLTTQGQDLLDQALADAQNDPRLTLGEATLEDLTQEYLERSMASSSPEIQQMVASLQQGEETSDAVGYNSPVLETGLTISRVEQFLASLYRALDDTHTQYEKELRGENLPVETRSPEQVRFDPPQEETSPFAPPYSVPTRALGGDPEAIALQAKSALNQTQKVWGEFGSKLKSGANKAKLQTQIDQSRNRILALEAEKQRLKTASETKDGLIVTPGISPSEQLKQIQRDIDKETQTLSDNQAKYNQLVQDGST